MKTPSGRVALNDKESVELSAPAADGLMTVFFKADKDGFYRIELQATTGERVTASPDRRSTCWPNVSFTKPGRDTTASSIEGKHLLRRRPRTT